MWQVYKRLGELLIADDHITNLQLSIGLAAQRGEKKRLGTILVERGYVTESVVTECLSKQFGYAVIDVKNSLPSQAAMGTLSPEIAKALNVLPLEIRGDALTCVISDPVDVVTTDQIARLTGRKLDLVLANETDLKQAIISNYVGQEAEAEVSNDGLIFGVPTRFTAVRLSGTHANSVWFQAEDSELGRPVTLSCVESKSGDRKEFRDAIRWLANSEGAHKLEIYDSVYVDGCRWTVFESFQGELFSNRLKTHRGFSIAEATATVSQLAETCAKIAKPGFTTLCDPDNIVLCEGQWKLAPIGISTQGSADEIDALGRVLFAFLTGDVMEPGIFEPTGDAFQKLSPGLKETIRRCKPGEPTRYTNPQGLAAVLKSSLWGATQVERNNDEELLRLMGVVSPDEEEPTRSFWRRKFARKRAA